MVIFAWRTHQPCFAKDVADEKSERSRHSCAPCDIRSDRLFFSSSSTPFLFSVCRFFFSSFRSRMDVTLAEAAITRFLYSINIEYTVSRFLFQIVVATVRNFERQHIAISCTRTCLHHIRCKRCFVVPVALRSKHTHTHTAYCCSLLFTISMLLTLYHFANDISMFENSF